MKMTKKLLIGAAALVAAMGLMSCGEKGGIVDTDPNGMLSGKNSDYTIDYTNDTGKVSRGLKETKMKHAGALVQITIDANSTAGSNKMGYIFDFKANADNKDASDFYIIGLGNDGKYYVSKFINVVDLCEDNFGTELTGESKATEVVEDGRENYQSALLKINNVPKDEAGNVVYYVYTLLNDEGKFIWKILDANPAAKDANLTDKAMKEMDFSGVNVLAEGIISDTDYDSYSSKAQQKIAVYGKVNDKEQLVGSWHFVGTYKEADVIEE